VIDGAIGQVDWLLAATMRDDENIWEDVDDNANGLETITLWGEERDWTRDILNLPHGGWETCFVSGETDVMRKVADAVSHGGVGFFCVDAALLKPGGGDTEENAHWRQSKHAPRTWPASFGPTNHSEDDGPPWPTHWIVYLGGLQLGTDPADDDQLTFRVWSWGAEYEVTCTVEALGEYLYAGVTGLP
jgi:hypothetical protein